MLADMPSSVNASDIQTIRYFFLSSFLNADVPSSADARERVLCHFHQDPQPPPPHHTPQPVECVRVDVSGQRQRLFLSVLALLKSFFCISSRSAPFPLWRPESGRSSLSA